MSNERSDKIHDSYREASEKFDYFIVGASFALLGYLGSQYRPTPLGWNPSTVELASLVAFLLSALAGLKRIETNVQLLAITHRKLYEGESAGAMTAGAAAGGLALNESTGDVLLPQQMMQRAQHHKVAARALDKILEEEVNRSRRWYRIRDAFLVAGLLFLICARVVGAYFC